MEGPPIAEAILKETGLDPARIEHVCRIIANHHSARDIDTLEFRVLWDADQLVNLQEDSAGARQPPQGALLGTLFRTAKGRQLAGEIFPVNEQGAAGNQP